MEVEMPTGIWMPDLKTIGVDPSTLPEGWGWTTLRRDEEVTFGAPLARKPGYGEFVVAPCVTDRKACNHTFQVTRLVIATASGSTREDEGLFMVGGDWFRTLVPLADAPHWWLFGPQGEQFFAFVEQCRGQGESLWRELSSYAISPYRSAVSAPLRRGPERDVQHEVDDLMKDACRKGAVARALHRATEVFYGFRANTSDRYRFVTSEGLAACLGSALYGTDHYAKEPVGAVDNAVRWLIMRDILPPELYRLVAEPWLATFGWPLHPEDAF